MQNSVKSREFVKTDRFLSYPRPVITVYLLLQADQLATLPLVSDGVYAVADLVAA